MFISMHSAHDLCMKLIELGIEKAGNPWRLSKELGINHCTLNNLKKHPGRILNGRHVISLIRYIGTDIAMDIIANWDDATVEEFLKEKEISRKKNYGNLKTKKIYRTEKTSKSA